MMKWMNQNICYPKEAQEYGVQGRVLVEFVIEKDGSITNVKALRGLGKDGEIVVTAYKAKDDTSEEVKKENEDKGRIAIQNEAIRMVKAMPNWNPGSYKDKPVRTKFVLPISFRLK
jgi:protein TonB